MASATAAECAKRLNARLQAQAYAIDNSQIMDTFIADYLTSRDDVEEALESDDSDRTIQSQEIKSSKINSMWISTHSSQIETRLTKLLRTAFTEVIHQDGIWACRTEGTHEGFKKVKVVSLIACLL